MNQIANIKDIKNIIVDVSEKINDKNLQEFTYNCLKSQTINYSQDDLIYSTYLHYSKKYQITVINKKYKYLIVEVLCVYYYDKTNINSFDLFISEDFFVLYKDMNIYYFQKLDYEISDIELREYIFRKLNINVENIFQIDKKVLERYKNDFHKENKKLININTPKNINFNIYLLFILSLILIVSYYFISSRFYTNIDSSLTQNKKTQNRYELFKEEHKFKSLHTEFILLIEQIKKYKLTLESFEFKKNRVYLIINSSKKEDLYFFLELHKNELITNKIEYSKDIKKYKVAIDVQLSK